MATTDKVKVLGTWWSPFVIRVRIALNLKSVDYEFIEEPLWPKSELLLKSNPVHQKIPVLIHNDRPISESAVIVRYIDDVWGSSPPPIFPPDPYDRATALFWSNFIDDKMFPNLRGISVAADEGAKEGEMGKLLEDLSRLEEVLTKSKGDKKFFGGERIGWLDIALGSLVGWFKAVEVFNNGVKLFDGTPSLSKWVEDFAAEDAVRRVLPSTQEFVHFGRGFSNKLQEAKKLQ